MTPDARVATQDFTGNLLEVLDGPEGQVFIDDRADMFPEAVVADYLTLVHGAPAWASVLDTYDVDIVVWKHSQPLGTLLATDARWHVAFADTTWSVACRRGAPVCDQLTG